MHILQKIKQENFSLNCSAILLFSCIPLFGQNIQTSGKQGAEAVRFAGSAHHSELISAPCAGSSSTDSESDKWKISFINTEIEHFTPEHEYLKKIKAEKLEKKKNVLPAQTTPLSFSSTVTPVIGTNFLGNLPSGFTPPDNTLAVSNGGYVVSAVNSTIDFYDSTGTQLYTNSLIGFYNDTTVTGFLYDPKVIYDAYADRFIAIFLHGSTDSTSHVLICFSKTNNPLNGWWKYKISGNVISGCWFDYPSVGISNNELFISGNTFYNAGIFNQSVVFQIEKSGGFSGGNLNYIWWGSISTGNLTYAFTVVPVSHGYHGNYGPGIYLVSHDNTVYSEIELHEITNDISNTPLFNTYSVLTTNWSPGPDALQSGTADLLDVGDPRITSAFFLDSTIHFVFHADAGSAYNGIFYNRLHVPTLTNSLSVFSLNGFDCVYGSVTPFSTSSTDKSVMISFLKSSSLTFPEIQVVHCDDAMNWSVPVQVQAGISFVNILGGNEERWGDYSGICRRHSAASPEIWLSGGYGNISNSYNTWIAQVHAGGAVPVPSSPVFATRSLLYPNPVTDFFNIDFLLPQQTFADIRITDVNGRCVKILYADRLPPGTNTLSFEKTSLSAGVYFVSVRTDKELIKHEKIIVGH